MINEPMTVVVDSFQEAWVSVVRKLMGSHWALRNLMVQIKDPALLDQGLHRCVTDFARHQGLLDPKHVAYTIFPHGLYSRTRNATRLFDAYNRENGLYDRVHKRKSGWGTYFRRMSNYDKGGAVVNQLGKIIDAIRSRQNVSKAAYTVVIQNPGGETVRPLGSPCLNYLAIQLERGNSMVLGLLAVYRNHEFLERAYGNYWGLCNLLRFLATEVGATAGPLTCISSRAYVSGSKSALRAFVDGL